MKIITLHQPWASLVALGLKRYETRHWSTSYRGPLLIHAARKPMSDRDGLISTIAVALHNSHPEKSPEQWFREICSFRLGRIEAIANLTKCLEMMNGWVETDPPPGFTLIQSKSELERSVGLWEPGRFALRLDSVQSLPQPIPFKSRQGKLLDAPPALQLMVRQQLERTA